MPNDSEPSEADCCEDHQGLVALHDTVEAATGISGYQGTVIEESGWYRPSQ